MKKHREVEAHRTNISAKQFYTYCKKRLAEKANVDIEMWTEYEEWVKPTYEYDIKNNHEDWTEPKREILIVRPYENQWYLEGSYNFILEWDDGIGYMYHVEFGE